MSGTNSINKCEEVGGATMDPFKEQLKDKLAREPISIARNPRRQKQ